MENNCLYVTWFCLLWTVTVGTYRSFVCRGQYWLVNHPFLSAVALDNDDCYVTWLCLSWTILVGIFHGCVCRGQYWLVYHPVLSSVDSYGWYILVGISTAFVCLSWTVMVGISSSFVCRGQYYTIIDFNEVDIRIYLPEKVIFTEAARPR